MSDCTKCKLIYELFKLTSSNYAYWLITELFTELHNGRDYCVGGEEAME